MSESVSVIIPTHNRAHLVPRAVESALAAMRDGDELIVIDDGSTDATEDVLARFADRIRYVRTPNRGAGPARNHGLDLARHPLIAFLDSDDEWTRDSLELKRALLAERPDLGFCFSDFSHRDEDGRTTPFYLVNWHHDERSWDDILSRGVVYSAIVPGVSASFSVHIGDMYPLLLQQPYVPAWTSLVRRAIAGDAFRFAEDLRTAEDWLCFGRIARRGPAAYMRCETAINHGHSGARLTSSAGIIGYLDAHLELARRVWGEDVEFQRAQGALYRQVTNSIRIRRSRWYLGRGMTEHARADLAAVGAAAPRSLRLLATLPGPMLSAAGGVRRRARAALGRAE